MLSAELRREVKFALPEADVSALRSILDVNCRRVRYRRELSRVTSLYFDDARLSGCNDNVEGAPRRAKLRLRWYDTEVPGESAFLELKWRSGLATGKERVELSLPPSPLTTIPFHALADALAASGAPEGILREALRARRDPVIVVEYDRAYYEAVDAPVRVTVDSDLVFYRQLGSCFLDRRFEARARGLVIVEGKTKVGEEHRLGAVLRPLAPRVSRSSKYVMGCRAVGLLPGNGYRP